MKKLLLLATAILSFQLKSQIATPSCTAGDTVYRRYHQDAERLALRRTYHINSNYKDSVTIDPALNNKYLSALYAVYNSSLTARDTVVYLLNIHTKPDPELNILLVNANGGNAWMQNLQNSVIPTGYTPIDNLIARYNLQEQAYYQSTQYDIVVFKRDSLSNITAIADQFTLEPTVLSATSGSTFNDVKNITDSINPNFIQLSYSYGWGTCGDGCDFRSIWTFDVFPNCIVKYVGHTGDNLVITGIKETVASFNNVVLYPNPASELLNVKFTSAEVKSTELDILNSLGQTVIHKNLTTTNQEIDLSSLNSGIYFVKLKNELGQKVVKLLKE